MIIKLAHPTSGVIKEVSTGFSILGLLLGGFHALFRGQILLGIIFGVLFIVTSGISNIVYAFICNKMYLDLLLKRGHKPQGNESIRYLTDKGLYSAPPASLKALSPQTPTATSIPTATPQNSFPEVSTNTDDLLVGNQFLMANISSGFNMKTEYDVISVASARVALQLREANMGAGKSLLKMGLNTSSAASYQVLVTRPNGEQVMMLSGGGLKGHVEVVGSSGHKMGGLTKSGLTKIKFEIYDESGVIFNVESNGVGELASKFRITHDGAKVGWISNIGDKAAKQLLGGRDRMLNAKYTYMYLIDLNVECSDHQKSLLVAAGYAISHVMGF